MKNRVFEGVIIPSLYDTFDYTLYRYHHEAIALKGKRFKNRLAELVGHEVKVEGVIEVDSFGKKHLNIRKIYALNKQGDFLYVPDESFAQAI